MEISGRTRLAPVASTVTSVSPVSPVLSAQRSDVGRSSPMVAMVLAVGATRLNWSRVRASREHNVSEDTFDSMVEYLRDQGLDVMANGGKWNSRILCPWCHGGTTGEKSLSVKYDGDLVCKCWRANKCGRTVVYRNDAQKRFHRWRGSPNTGGSSESAKKPGPTAVGAGLGQKHLPLAQEHVAWFETRGISLETLRRNRVCSKTLKNGIAIVFPYYEGKKIVAEKLRQLPKIYWQTSGGKKCLYGVDDVKDSEEVIVTEGEIDKLSFDEAGLRCSASIQNGASAGVDQASLQLLRAPKRVVLALDSDPAGQECAKNLAEQLSWRRCYLVKWPEGCKDANEVLLRHGTQKLRQLVEEAEEMKCPWQSRLITKEIEESVRQRIDGTMPNEMVSGVSTGWSSLNALWRPVPGELTVATGVPGHGKSEFLLSLAVNLGHLHDYRTLLFGFESTSENLSTQSYKKVARTCYRGEDADYDRAMAWVDEHIMVENTFEADDDVTIDGILETARQDAENGKLNLLIVDPYNFIERSQDEAKMFEHHYIGKILQRLRKFAEDYRLHVIIVAHPTKATSWENEKKPTLYSIAGSSNWFNKTDNGLVMYRQVVIDDDGKTVPSNRLEICVEKVRNREAGKLGTALLLFDTEMTRCYSDLPHANKFEGPLYPLQAVARGSPVREMALAAGEDEQCGEY